MSIETKDKLTYMKELTLNLAQNDPEVFQAIQQESIRQKENIELIASENYTSLAVMQAQGSIFTNKYAEGYPGKRYYSGCEIADVVENLAIERLKQLYQADFANVQSHSGSQANQAVFLALLNPGDLILGMDLNHGGHLTHGMKLNLSGKWFNVISYGLNEQEDIDYVKMRELALEHKPKLIIAGASAFSLQIDFEFFAKVAKEVGAYLMVDMAHYSGLIAAGLYQNPYPFADVVTSTTHKGLRGPRGGFILMKEPLAKKINSAVFPGLQGGPLVHVIAAKAVAFKEALSTSFKVYQKQVLANASCLAQELAKFDFRIVSARTQCHMMLIDLRNKNINGQVAEHALYKAGINCNKNSVPNDTKAAMNPSGIRFGTNAVTTRGFKEKEIVQLANLINQAIELERKAQANQANQANINREFNKLKAASSALLAEFPLY